MTEQLERKPFSINMFMPDGNPNGLRIIAKNTGLARGVVFNRTNYKQVVVLPEVPIRVIETRSGLLLIPLTRAPMDAELEKELAE